MKNGAQKIAACISSGLLATFAFSSFAPTTAQAQTFATSELTSVAADILRQMQTYQNTVSNASTPVSASRVLPAATVPDPLDYASQPDDPDTYLIPAAADRFKKPNGTYEIDQPQTGGQSAGAIVAGLEKYYNQYIEWGACKDFSPAGGNGYNRPNTECAYLIVPVDYNNPTGATAAIALMKVPAKNPAEKIGTLFLDPGGPGGSGVNFARYLAGNQSEINDKFDIVGFDPRGVASSLPMIRCKSSAAMDAQRQGSDLLTAQKRDELLKYNTDECYKNTGKLFNIDGESFINNVGTVNVVKDLDIARAVVGDKQLTYLGYSYGTSIGYQYAMAFPDNIRALVLDGVVNPFENNPAEAAKYAQYTASTSGTISSEHSQMQGFQATFDNFMLKCATEGFNGKPCALGNSTDKQVLLAEYQKIAQKAWGGTTYQLSDDSRVVSFEDLTTGTIQAMYTESYWEHLNDALLELLTSNTGDLIMELADDYYGRNPAGKYSFQDSAFQTIWCTDAGTPDGANDPATNIASKLEGYKVAPFTDPGKNPDGSQRGIEPSKDWCTFYKKQQTMPQGQSLTAIPNILFISTTYDPSTPYQDGVVAAAASEGTVLTVAGNTHTSYWPGVGDCTDQIATRYLVDLNVPTDITGATGVETKDLYSTVVTGNECRVDSFQKAAAAESKTAKPGQTIDLTVTGLIRNTEYTLELPADYTLAGSVKADIYGAAKFTVTIPADASIGDVEYNVILANSAAGAAAIAKGVITVAAYIPTPLIPITPATPVTPATPANPAAPAAPAAPANTQKAENGKLASTGADFSAGLIAFAAVLGTAGAAFAATKRRKK